MARKKSTYSETDAPMVEEPMVETVEPVQETPIMPVSEIKPEPKPEIKPAPVAKPKVEPVKPVVPVTTAKKQAAMQQPAKKRVRDRKKQHKKLSVAVLCTNPMFRRFS